MKVIIAAVLFFTLTTLASSSERPLLSCKSDELSLALKRELKMESPINGWKNYWGKVEYKVKDKSGVLDAKISWRKDPRPGFNALYIALMDKKEADFRKEGIEGGREGFGAIDSREEIKGTFKAKWSAQSDSEDAPELSDIYNAELVCEIAE